MRHDDVPTTSASQDSRDITSTSRTMLERLKDKDGDAWNRLVLLYSPLIYYWCQKMDLPQDDIPDVVQNVFLSVASRIDTFAKEKPKDTFRGWLRVITRHKAIDYFRQSEKQCHGAGGSDALSRMADVPDQDASESIQEDRKTRSILFHSALELIRQEFSERTWLAFWRVVIDDRTPSEVAEEMDMRAGTVRVAKCRVLSRLRQEMESLHFDG